MLLGLDLTHRPALTGGLLVTDLCWFAKIHGRAPAQSDFGMREKAATRVSGIGCEARAERRPPPGIFTFRRPLGAASAKPHRTFGRRNRHICIGDFSAPMSKRTPPSDDIPLARRCAFPAALVSSTRASRAETGRTTRPPGCRWRVAAAPVTAFSRSARAAPFAVRGADVHIAISLLFSPANQFFPNVRLLAKFDVSSKITVRRNSALVLKSPAF